MGLKAIIEKHQLNFKKPATTSRGALLFREIFLIKLYNEAYPEIIGIGECAPLKGLSIDDVPNYEKTLHELADQINKNKNTDKFDFTKYPSIKFGLETALLDLKNGGKQIVFKNFYSIGKQGIPINGLIWMSDFDDMLEEAKEKISKGFKCIKVKIGAIDFDKECRLIEYITQYKDVVIRLDANGAFNESTVFDRLQALKKFNIHSIEQPVKSNQLTLMKKVINESPIPIALDEELIGKFSDEEINNLLSELEPHYIVLKPNLLGGFLQTEKWIKAAEKLKIQWWITSALESNIGLNAIAQFTANYQINTPQGLGTGHLYTSNFKPYSIIESGYLWKNMGNEVSDN